MAGRRRGSSAGLACALLPLLAPFAASAGIDGPSPGGRGIPPDRVVVVANEASPVSVAIAETYVAARGIPRANLLRLRIPVADPLLRSAAHETITREFFERRVRDPIRAFLRRRDPQGRILVLVTTKGIPLRIARRGPRPAGPLLLRDEDAAAVDAELALLGSGRDGEAGVVGLANPYFDSALPFERFRELHPEAPLRYLVARITGYQDRPAATRGVPRDVARLLEAARAVPPLPGVVLVDEDPTRRGGLAAANEVLLRPVARLVESLGLSVRHDRSEVFVAGLSDLAGYVSWGSNDGAAPQHPTYGEGRGGAPGSGAPDGRSGSPGQGPGAGPNGTRGRPVPGRFLPRSLALDLVSTNARTFSAPQEKGQSLVADLIALGAAGLAGSVYEPSLPGVPRPDVLFDHYLRGAPAVEAFFRAVPYLGWMSVYVGDPLMQVAAPPRADAGDRDLDGVPDAVDRCLRLEDPAQVDGDGDGYGTACDPDLDGDGRVTTGFGRPPEGDLERLARAVATGGDPALHDLDGDGVVGRGDLARAGLWLFLPPGPSGVVGAGPAPAARPGPAAHPGRGEPSGRRPQAGSSADFR